MSPPPRSRSRLRRIARWTAILCAVVVGAYLLRRPLFERWIAGRIEGALAERLGGVWHVETVEGGWITDAAVTGVRATTPPADGPVRDLAIRRADVTCTAFGLLSGTSSIRSVRVTGLVGDLDLTRPARASSAEPGTSDAGSGWLANLPHEVPDVEIDGAVTLRTADGDVRCDAVKVRGGTAAFSIDATSIQSRRAGEGRAWNDTLPAWTARFERPSATRLSLVSADPAAGVEFDRIEIELAGASGAEIEVGARVAGGTVRGTLGRGATHIEAKDLDLARLPSWVAATVGATPPGLGRFDATLDAGAAGPATVRVTGRHWTLPDLPAATFTADVTLGGGVVQVASLDGVCGGVRVVARDLAIDPADPWIARSAGEVRATTDDLAAAMRAFGADDDVMRAFDGEGPVAAGATLVRERGGAVAVRDCTVRAPGTAVTASGTVTLPSRREDWRDARVAVRAEIAADFVDAASSRRFGAQVAGHVEATVAIDGIVASPALTFTVAAPKLRVEGRDLTDCNARASLRGGVLTLDAAAATDAAGAVRASGTVVPATGEVRGARIDADVTHVAALFGQASGGAPSVAGTVHATARLDRAPGTERPRGAEAWLRGLAGTIDAASDDLAVAGVRLQSAAAHLRVAGPVVTCESCSARMPGAAFEATGVADVVAGSVTGLRAVARVEDLAQWAASAAGDAATLPHLGGRGTVTLRVPDGAIADLGGGGIAPDGTRIDVALDGATLGGAALGTAKLSATASGGALGFKTSLSGGEVTLDARGVVARRDEVVLLSLTEASCARGALRARLATPAAMAISAGRVALAETAIDVTRVAAADQSTDDATDAAADDAPTGRITVRGSLGDTLDLHVAGDGLDTGLVAEDFDGAASLRVTASGPPASPVAEVSLEVPSFTAFGLSGSVHVLAKQDPDGIHVTRVAADAAPDPAVTEDGDASRAPRSKRAARIAARRAALRAAAHPGVATPPSFTLGGSGDLPWVVGTRGIVSVEGRTPEAVVRLGTDDAGPWIALAGIDGLTLPRTVIDLAWRDGAANLEWTAARGTWTPGGISEYAIDGALTVRARVDGASAEAVVDGTSSIGSALHGHAAVGAGIDWSAPADSVRRMLDAPLEGELTVDVPDLSQRRDAMPELAELGGRATGKVGVGGTLALPSLVGRFDASGVAVRVKGSGQGFDRGSVHVAFAGREIRVEGIEGRLGYGPVAVTGTISLAPGGPVADLRVHGENVLVAQDDTVRIRADADLRVTGPMDAARIAGDAVVRDALVALELESAGAQAASPSGVHLFALPPGPLADATFDVRVTADRTIRIVNDRIRGEASADLRIRGTGALPEPEGRVEFPGLRVHLPFTQFTVETGVVEFPRAAPFTPRVYATAQSRTRDYDVTARVSGDVTAIDIDVATAPSLPRDDALLLVVTGASPKDLQARGLDSVALSRAQTLVGSELFSQIVRPADPAERSFIDRVSVEISQDKDARGRDAIQASYEIDDDLLLRIERDHYLNYNFGLVTRVRFR